MGIWVCVVIYQNYCDRGQHSLADLDERIAKQFNVSMPILCSTWLVSTKREYGAKKELIFIELTVTLRVTGTVNYYFSVLVNISSTMFSCIFHGT